MFTHYSCEVKNNLKASMDFFFSRNFLATMLLLLRGHAILCNSSLNF